MKSLTALLGYLSVLLEYIMVFIPTPRSIILPRYHSEGTKSPSSAAHVEFNLYTTRKGTCFGQ